MRRKNATNIFLCWNTNAKYKVVVNQDKNRRNYLKLLVNIETLFKSIIQPKSVEIAQQN